uniref:Protein kinase domain-containing protein n=1 Tax=Heterorhabditis bacteriophora TaxID=37862 RepID=A0A1I7XT76_HETBA
MDFCVSPIEIRYLYSGRKYIPCEFHLGSDLYDFFHQRHFNADAMVNSMKALGIIYTRNPALRTSDFNASFVYLLDYEEATQIKWSEVVDRRLD